MTAGNLLAQIVFWYLPGKSGKSKLRAFKLGYWWIAKSREEWMFETGLTLEEYKLAIRMLEAKKIVEVKQMPWDGDEGEGYNLSHVRLVDKTVLNLSGGNHTARVVGKAPPRVVGITPPCTTERSTERVTERSTQCIGLQPERTDQDLINTAGGKEVVPNEEEEKRKEEEERKEVVERTPNTTAGEGWLMKATDILKAHKAPAEGSLGAYWKKQCTLVLGGFQRALTGKECGQLKQLHTYLGADTRPIIDYAVNHWWKFASRAGAAAGTSFPAEPNIGFLLKHHGVAMNLLKPEVQTPSPPTVEAPVQLIANTETEPVHTLTSQELTELLDGLKSP